MCHVKIRPRRRARYQWKSVGAPLRGSDHEAHEAHKAAMSRHAGISRIEQISFLVELTLRYEGVIARAVPPKNRSFLRVLRVLRGRFPVRAHLAKAVPTHADLECGRPRRAS